MKKAMIKTKSKPIKITGGIIPRGAYFVDMETGKKLKVYRRNLKKNIGYARPWDGVISV